MREVIQKVVAVEAEAKHLAQAARAEAAREKAERLGCASAEINTNLRLDEAVAQPAVNAALCCLCGNSP